MINTQTDIMSLFLPVQTGMPIEGAKIPDGESAEGRIQNGDFLKLLLGSLGPDAKVIEIAPLSDAAVVGNETIAEQVPAGSEESSDIVIPEGNFIADPVFGAVNLIPPDHPVLVQFSGREASPDEYSAILQNTVPVANQETKADTPWNKYIVSKGWQIGRSNNFILPAEKALPAEGKFTAGRIVDPVNAFLGKETVMPPKAASSPNPGPPVNTDGQIIILDRSLADDGAITEGFNVASDQRLNRLAENLAVRTAEITPASPERSTGSVPTDFPQKVKAAFPEKPMPDKISIKAAGPERLAPKNVVAKTARPEISAKQDVLEKPFSPKTAVPSDVPQEQPRPALSPEADFASKVILSPAPDLKPIRPGNVKADKTDVPRMTAASPKPAEKIVDDKTVIRPVANNNDVSSGVVKEDRRESSETNMAVKSSPQTSSESSKPIVLSGSQTEKSVSSVPRTEIPSVRFVLSENIRETVMRPGNTITIRMEPEHLGSVRLTLTSHHDTVIGRVVVESPAAKLAVESNVHVLQNRLSDEGLHLEQFHVSVGGDQTRQFGFGDGSQFDQTPTARTALSGPAGHAAAAEISTPSATYGGYVNAGGVNWLA